MTKPQQPTPQPTEDKPAEEPMIWLFKPSGPKPAESEAKAEDKKPAQPNSK